jgi:hypothetical protein
VHLMAGIGEALIRYQFRAGGATDAHSTVGASGRRATYIGLHRG